MIKGTINVLTVNDTLDLAHTMLVNGYSVTINPDDNKTTNPDQYYINKTGRTTYAGGFNVDYSKEDKK